MIEEEENIKSSNDNNDYYDNSDNNDQNSSPIVANETEQYQISLDSETRNDLQEIMNGNEYNDNERSKVGLNYDILGYSSNDQSSQKYEQ